MLTSYFLPLEFVTIVGDYDVDIPEDTTSGMYKIRVGRFEDEALFGCSGTFEIIGSEHNDDDDHDDDDDDFSASYDFWY